MEDEGVVCLVDIRGRNLTDLSLHRGFGVKVSVVSEVDHTPYVLLLSSGAIGN